MTDFIGDVIGPVLGGVGGFLLGGPAGAIAGAGIGASLGGSKKQSSAIEGATAAQQDATSQQIAFQREELARTRADLAEAVDAGIIDLNTAYGIARGELQPFADPFAFEQAQGFLQDPSQAMNLPGVQFQYEQGQDALGNLLSKTTGGGLSSDAIRAAQQYGQNFASTQLDTALGRLAPFINLQQQTSSNLANLATGRGQQVADLRMRGAGGQAGVTGAFAPSIAQNIGQQGTIAAQGALGQANVTSQLLGNLAGVGGQAMNAFALQQALQPQQTFQGPGQVAPGSYLNNL